MKNIINILNLENEVDVDNAAIFRGKMTPRKKANHCNLKHGDAKHRRAALKRSEYNKNSQFGQEGHSSSWD